MKCQHEEYFWGPHPGCKEFAHTPDTSYCRNEATYMVHALCTFVPEPPHTPYPERQFLCDEHAAIAYEATHNDPCFTSARLIHIYVPRLGDSA
jgi:hypothetical protein